MMKITVRGEETYTKYYQCLPMASKTHSPVYRDVYHLFMTLCMYFSRFVYPDISPNHNTNCIFPNSIWEHEVHSRKIFIFSGKI